jgi:hypothetical protein
MAIHRHRAAAPLLASLLVPAFLIAGMSAAEAQNVRVSGMGVRKCSEWQQWKEAQNGEARALALEWAQGFIAGHNVYARSGNQQANSVVASDKVLIPLLDIYCQKNPDTRILSGVIEITQSLGGTKINITPKPPPRTDPRPNSKGESES